ncbi:hypothetical protein RchiOBHm_Chr5g0070621 [Rosa chinensis]|uniref:Uncharacterized protein n=1 Tax=Rosa chinensis TaxID=74649 RepID=A0A2P6QK77_ROSCH|nr:hypothetical protein RchiOBHm_Chr5g0070621 [Rosa chinensis]
MMIYCYVYIWLLQQTIYFSLHFTYTKFGKIVIYELSSIYVTMLVLVLLSSSS